MQPCHSNQQPPTPQRKFLPEMRYSPWKHRHLLGMTSPSSVTSTQTNNNHVIDGHSIVPTTCTSCWLFLTYQKSRVGNGKTAFSWVLFPTISRSPSLAFWQLAPLVSFVLWTSSSTDWLTTVGSRHSRPHHGATPSTREKEMGVDFSLNSITYGSSAHTLPLKQLKDLL